MELDNFLIQQSEKIVDMDISFKNWLDSLELREATPDGWENIEDFVVDLDIFARNLDQLDYVGNQ